MNQEAPRTFTRYSATERVALTDDGQPRKLTKPLGLIHAFIIACRLEDAHTSEGVELKREEWALTNIDEPCHHILHRWRVIEVSPLGVCYWPVPGPRY
jgi:hypothetical protein